MSFLQFWAKNMLMRFVSIVVAVTVASFAGKAEADVAFRRADANGDLRVDISDVAYTTNYLFKGSPALGSDDAGDANDDGVISLSDSIYTWNYLFTGGPPPPAPFPDTGTDPTTDSLGSTTYPSNLVNPGAALSFSGPTQVFAAPGITVEIPVSVWLTSPVSQGPEAWSVGVSTTDNGSITAATTQGTDAALATDSPPGLRGSSSFERTELISNGAYSSVLLSLTQVVELPADGVSHILDLTISATAPAAGNTNSLLLSFTDSFASPGGPMLDNVATIGGLSYLPSKSTHLIHVTAIPEPSALIYGGLLSSVVGFRAWKKKRRRAKRCA